MYKWLGLIPLSLLVAALLVLTHRQPVLDGDAIGDGPIDWSRGSFPVESFTRYTSPFGNRQHPMGGWRFHAGLDIAAPRGSFILNWWDGTVSYVGSDEKCGVHVRVESGPWSAVYCHMDGEIVEEKEGGRVMVSDGLTVRQGTQVKAGDRIGRIGMTGSTTGPHLHWGLRYDGDWVDPAFVIRAMAEAKNAT